jgi:hypothetical protein
MQMKKKRLPWYYWIPVIGILPVVLYRSEPDENELFDRLFDNWYFEYQVTLLIVLMTALIGFAILIVKDLKIIHI